MGKGILETEMPAVEQSLNPLKADSRLERGRREADPSTERRTVSKAAREHDGQSLDGQGRRAVLREGMKDE